ncbi:MAG: pirin family protein [Bacteroidetes bacterium]|nr:MAG: pirin family protein [Bacteroidota bacterium]
MENKIIKAIRPLGFPWETQDPFLFCVYHKDYYPPGDEHLGVKTEDKQGHRIGQDFQLKDGFRMYHGSHVPGFPYHPHRGFETVTINREGFVDHCDSLGGAGRFGAGDVQWMTAGRGVQHSEMFPLLSQEKSNPLEIFQIWLNLPAAKKMVDPHFKMLWKDQVPTLKWKDQKGQAVTLELIAGNLDGQKAPHPTPESWAADPAHEVQIWHIQLDPEAEWTIPAATSNQSHRNLYFYQGQNIVLDGQTILSGTRIELTPDSPAKIINGTSPCSLLFLQGKPIGEKVVQYGPFVMNSEKEIQEAFEEYRRNEFGAWPWPEQEQTHGATTGRFARFPDGREEYKE